MVSVLGNLANDAHNNGITLGLEICYHCEAKVISTHNDALRLAQDVGADSVRIYLETLLSGLIQASQPR